MSLHYLLDGYNIVNKIPGLGQKSLNDQRQSLVKFIDVKRPQGSIKNAVTIVFDGKLGIIGQATSSCAKVIFTKNRSADDEIIRLVGEAKYPKEMVVVSDDRNIQFSVRRMGASILSVHQFLGMPKGHFHKEFSNLSSGEIKDAKHISKSLEFKITEEFEKIWVKDKKKGCL